jgi:hypothetical protein
MPSNPPAQSHFNLDNANLNGWMNSAGTTVRRHSAYKAGQLAMINWTLVEGTDALLYENEVGSIGTRKQLHLFKGKEAVVVLQDANDFAAEVKVAYGEKIGWVNAYLLLPIEEEDVGRLGARKRTATKKTAARALGDMGSGDPTVSGSGRKIRTDRR